MRFLIPLLAVLISGCLTCKQKEPFLRAHLTFIEKTYNWVQADVEAAKYRGEEDAARAYLKSLREVVTIPEVEVKLKADGFHWKREKLDFTSYPWVTIARRRGDCDDFMALWEAVVKYRGKTKRVFVSSVSGSAHAMLLFYPKGTTFVYLFSNTGILGMGGVGSEEQLVRLFYKEKTSCFILY